MTGDFVLHAPPLRAHSHVSGVMVCPVEVYATHEKKLLCISHDGLVPASKCRLRKVPLLRIFLVSHPFAFFFFRRSCRLRALVFFLIFFFFSCSTAAVLSLCQRVLAARKSADRDSSFILSSIPVLAVLVARHRGIEELSRAVLQEGAVE